MKTKKRTIVITGVSGGIGKACAELFFQNDWQVIGTDIKENKIKSIDTFIQVDNSQPEALKTAYDNIKTQLGRIDALVNNAAMQICKPFIETSLEDWDSIMASNLRSVYLNVRYAYPLLKQEGGAIVNVSSVHALATSPNFAAYAASKGAISALSRGLAIEFSKDRIRVNAVLPGAVDTPMLRDGLNSKITNNSNMEDQLRALEKRIPAGRIGRPEDIAKMVLFLADNNNSSYVTGQEFVVDGGVTAQLSSE
ncbi:MAG: SDR family oxidoreductase [Bacteroidetes bacterium]|nr:SDR family oxidoreductase [Bacteroidota bacterium]